MTIQEKCEQAKLAIRILNSRIKLYYKVRRNQLRNVGLVGTFDAFDSADTKKEMQVNY
jgi:hypothetical protein